MKPPLPDSVFEAVAATARAIVGLDLLILFRSRARGEARPGANREFGYLANEGADVPGLRATLVEVLDDDHVDLIDLRRAGALLRYRAACDSLLVHEGRADLFQRYSLEAVQFWCENAPVFERGYDEVLETLWS